jgi:hypothetical protein
MCDRVRTPGGKVTSRWDTIKEVCSCEGDAAWRWMIVSLGRESLTGANGAA